MLMSPSQLNTVHITAGLQLLPPALDVPNARRFMVSWALQETALAALRQYGNGPAASVYQFERPTIQLVLDHAKAGPLAKSACGAVGVQPTARAIWDHFQTMPGQALASVFARLLMWCDPHPLPLTAADGWTFYAKYVVRPGKPHEGTWPANWNAASDAVGIPA